MSAAFAFIARLLATLLHAALVFGLAPLLMGVVTKLRAYTLGRRGPPVLQPYRQLFKLLRKTTLVPKTATDFYPVWPVTAFLSLAVAALLVPGFCLNLLTAPLADLITLAGLLSLARAATMLAGLETGFGFGGLGAQREALYGVFAEAAFLVVLITFALLTGGTGIDGIALSFRTHAIGISVSLAFALAALLAVALTETGRLPTDNPAGHLELGMVHEAMILEYSGRFLLLFEYAAMLRLLLWMSLIATLFFPFGMASATAPFSWLLGLVLWGAKLGGMCAVLAAFEIATAKMRVFRVPEFLSAAVLLGVLAGVFLFVAARIGS